MLVENTNESSQGDSAERPRSNREDREPDWPGSSLEGGQGDRERKTDTRDNC